MKHIRSISTTKKRNSSPPADEKITDPIKIRQSLSIIHHSYASVVIWEESIGVKPMASFMGQFHKKDQTFTMEFPADLTKEALECWSEVGDELDQSPKSCHFLVFLKRGGILGFVAPLLELDDTEKLEAKFKFPEVIFRLKRRKEERFEIPGGYDIRVKFRDPRGHQSQMQRNVFDLSESGFSFLISKNLAVQFSKNLIFNQMQITLRGKKLVFSAQVKSKTLMYPGSLRECYKIGFEFKRMEDQDKELLSQYILENQIQYFSQIT